MGGELRKIEVWISTRDSSQAPPLPNGQRAYSDDIVGEVQQVIRAALAPWYESGGHNYVNGEPDVI